MRQNGIVEIENLHNIGSVFHCCNPKDFSIRETKVASGKYMKCSE
jgi:hypothetical protein